MAIEVFCFETSHGSHPSRTVSAMPRETRGPEQEEQAGGAETHAQAAELDFADFCPLVSDAGPKD
jgi:hypothetical protein